VRGAETLPLVGSLLRRCVALADVHILLQTSHMYIVPRSLRNVRNSVFVAAACILQRVTNHRRGTASSLREEQDVLCSAAYLGSASQLLRPFVGTDRDCGGISVPTENNSFCSRGGVFSQRLYSKLIEKVLSSTAQIQPRCVLCWYVLFTCCEHLGICYFKFVKESAPYTGLDRP